MFFIMTDFIVAPFVGAWIEIAEQEAAKLTSSVAPFVGAWIEIAWDKIKGTFK